MFLATSDRKPKIRSRATILLLNDNRIIALFGERFANQYLSEAYSVWDCVVFATAPLGVISAIVAAIRVAGPVWMRAVIGRARENRASAELELMSSTSRDVGELWNGESVVRSMGRPSVLQLILIWSEINDPKTFGLYTLKTALAEGKMSYHGMLELSLDTLVISILLNIHGTLRLQWS
jgi:hypothetical protein